MLVIAHRGASAHAPENTLAAARLAWKHGADAVEGDLRLTRDHHVVVMHDETGNRTAGDSRRVRDLTLTQLAQWDVGRWKGPEWTGEPVPTLTDLLKTLPPGRSLVLELKENDGLAERTRETIAESAVDPERVVLIAFDLATIREAKRLLPGCRALWLFGDFQLRAATPGWLGRWLAGRALAAGLDGVDLRFHKCITPELVQELHASGLVIFTYTVNDAAAAKHCASLGIDGLTTDDPAAIRAALR